MSRREYAFLPYLIFAQRTTTKKEEDDMKTLSEIIEIYENATPEEKRKIVNFTLQIPEAKVYAGIHLFNSLTPAEFEMLKRRSHL